MDPNTIELLEDVDAAVVLHLHHGKPRCPICLLLLSTREPESSRRTYIASTEEGRWKDMGELCRDNVSR